MSRTTLKSKTPLALQAYEKIHEKIITMELEPGAHIDEKRLLEELGIGRTPIREALLRLASEFLIESRPNKGFVVKPVTFQNVKAMFEALRIVEVGAAFLAVQQDITKYLLEMRKSQKAVKKAIKENDLLGLVKANHNFHMYFAECSSNEYLIRALTEIRNEVNRLAYLSFGGAVDLNGDLHEHYDTVIKEHELIMKSLERRDLETLEATLIKHIQTFQRRVVSYLTS